MEYAEYREEFLEQIKELAFEDAISNEEAFFAKAVDILNVYNELEYCNILALPNTKGSVNRVMRVDGYSIDSVDNTLILLINDYAEVAPVTPLNMTMVNDLYWKLYYYMDEVCDGEPTRYLDKECEAFKAIRDIRPKMNANNADARRILKVKFIIVTNRDLNTRLLDKDLIKDNTTRKTKRKTKKPAKIKKDEYKGRPLEIDIWNIERFFELDQANNEEPVEIDFPEDFNCNGIPCLECNVGQHLDYSAYMAVIPGKLLSDIYMEYGSKVLEGNVRAFLGTASAKGVNRGIKNTINNEPEKFFIYNNGIATTAAEAEVELVNGQPTITHILDFQIINGGQTTATLSEAVLKKSNVDLSGIYVPMKLTVIKNREAINEDGISFYDQTVKDIARYANSQNKVTAADLFSNDPFHIWMEKASKRYLAPPVNYVIQTGWYYERARKKYVQEQVKLKGDALKRFQNKYPKKQVVTKEQLAMYLTAVACNPNLVSRGRTWTMKAFGAEIGDTFSTTPELFNEHYYHKCVAAAILYRTVDGYLEKNKRDPDFWYKPGGSKLNIVPYTISKVMASLPKGKTINWEKIWEEQSLSPAFMNEIARLTKITNDFINNSNGMLVTEFCKKPTTWEAFRDEVKYSFSDEFIDELISVSEEKKTQKEAKTEQKEVNYLQTISDIVNAGYLYWERLLEEGKKRNLVNPADIASLQTAIKYCKTGQIPSVTNSGVLSFKSRKEVDSILDVKSRLESEGIGTEKKVEDNIPKEVSIKLTNWNMH